MRVITAMRAAGSMDLSGAFIWNIRGNAAPDATQGFPASMDLTAASFKMWGGNVWTSEDLSLTVASADIRGASIDYGRELKESIGGAPDSTPPMVNVLSPASGATIDKTMDLRVQVADPGASVGVRTVRAKGPIGDITFTLANCGPTSNCTWSPSDNTLTAMLPAIDPTTPATLEVTATDNKGNASSPGIVSGLNVPAGYEVEPNACYDYYSGNLCGRPDSHYHLQRFTLLGEVSQTDDAENRAVPDSPDFKTLWFYSGGAKIDFCEDLVLLDDYFDPNSGSPTPVVATLTWDGPWDLDLRLMERWRQCSVRNCWHGWSIRSSHNHPAGVNQEQVEAALSSLSNMLLCVTWYDPNGVSGVTVPYRLDVEIGKMVTFNLTAPAGAGGLEYVTGTSGTGPPFKYLVYTDDAHPNSVSAAFSTQPDTIQYHYTLDSVDGSVSRAEVDASCNPVTRTLTLLGGRGTQTVNDTVIHWQGVAPCP